MYSSNDFERFFIRKHSIQSYEMKEDVKIGRKPKLSVNG